MTSKHEQEVERAKLRLATVDEDIRKLRLRAESIAAKLSAAMARRLKRKEALDKLTELDNPER